MKKYLVLIILLTFNTASSGKERVIEQYSQISPEQVVRTFVELDGLNIIYTDLGWSFIELLTEWKAAPGWDEFYLVKDYEIKTISKSGDTAVIDVTYELLGRLSNSEQFERKEALETIRIKLRQDIYGAWKIYEPLPFPPHLFSKYCVDEKGKKCTKRNYESKAK